MNFELPQMKYPKQEGLISIIVPIYNTKNDSLKECLDSILAQTFENWEAILVNDGSTADTGNILDEYAKKDSRFVVIHKQNEGTLLARKTGLENSKGEFIANIDHDDTYYPQFLERMYAKITETSADFVWCKYQTESFCQGLDYRWNTDISENIAAMLTHQKISYLMWDKLVKREIYARVHFPIVHIVYGEDPIQALQVALHSKTSIFVPESLYYHKLTGFSSVQRPLVEIRFIIVLNNVLKNIFNGIVHENVTKAFSLRYTHIIYSYFFLDKKTRIQFKDEIRQFLPGLMKVEKKFNLKACLFLASKGMEFPFELRECVRKIYVKIKGK